MAAAVAARAVEYLPAAQSPVQALPKPSEDEYEPATQFAQMAGAVAASAVE
jgi:hypothetical protein